MRAHTTHYACDAVLKKYGGKSIGCCCTGHKCRAKWMVVEEPITREEAIELASGVHPAVYGRKKPIINSKQKI
jgi:hypothetical protein